MSFGDSTVGLINLPEGEYFIKKTDKGGDVANTCAHHNVLYSSHIITHI